jgi:hypothetical protein
MSYSTPSLLNVSVLHYNVSTKAVQWTSNFQQLSLSRLMHSTAVAFYFQTKNLKDDIFGCVGLRNIKI